MQEAVVARVIESHAEGYFILCLRSADADDEVRLRVHADDYFAAGSPAEGDTLYAEDIRCLTRRERSAKAYGRAVKILASGDNTRRALKRKLIERGFEEEDADYAVARLSEEGYLKEDEMLYRQFAVFAKRMWGPGKFMPSLLAKGFSKESIEEAARTASAEGIYCAEAVKAELLARFAPKDRAEEKALLYKYGFRS